MRSLQIPEKYPKVYIMNIFWLKIVFFTLKRLDVYLLPTKIIKKKK